MACLTYSSTITKSCRNAQPGVSKLFLIDYADVKSYTLDTTGIYLSGITLTGTTAKFYPVAVGKQVASFLDTATISNENGTSVSLPKIMFKIPSLDATVITMYKQLMQTDVVAVAKTINGDLYILGLVNGLSMSVGTLGTEKDATGFMGATFELSGIEASPFYKVNASLNFETAYVV